MELVVILNYNYYPVQYAVQEVKRLVVSVCKSVSHSVSLSCKTNWKR